MDGKPDGGSIPRDHHGKYLRDSRFPENSSAGVESRPGCRDIVNQKNAMTFTGHLALLEGSFQILHPTDTIKPSLGSRIPGPMPQIFDRYFEISSEPRRKKGGLIEFALPLSQGMKWYWNNRIELFPCNPVIAQCLDQEITKHWG